MAEAVCPPSYCGVPNSSVTDVLQCSSCRWGYKANSLSVCELCTLPLPLYDWLYLGFMFFLSLVLHWIVIDINTNRKSYRMIMMYVSSALECAVAAVCSLLLMTPSGELNLYSCGVNSIQDWYSVFYNPTIKHTTTLHCTQEVVYPLYTIVMIYYSLQIPAMVMFRPILFTKNCLQRGVDTTSPIYGALYFLPLLVLLQAVAGGLLYYCFPYLTLILSLVYLTAHLSHFEDQSVITLFSKSLKNSRSLVILIFHFFMQAYGILSLVLSWIDIRDDPQLTGFLFLLVPAPYLFYILSSPYTDPEKFEALASR